MTTEPPSGLSGSLDGACGLANDSSSLVGRRSSSGDSDTSALEENASGGDSGPADGWIPSHEGSRVGPIDQERELRGERIRIVDLSELSDKILRHVGLSPEHHFKCGCPLLQRCRCLSCSRQRVLTRQRVPDAENQPLTRAYILERISGRSRQ